MTPSARLAGAIELLCAIEAAPRRPVDAIANSFFRERRFIGGGDRRAISAIVWEVLRCWRRVTWHLARAGAREPTPRLLLSGMQALRGMPYDEIRSGFSGDRYAPSALDASERPVIEALCGQSLLNPDMPRAVALEVPDWLLPLLEDAFGETLESELGAMGEGAPLDLRVNLLKGTRAEARKALARAGIDATNTLLSPWGLRVEGRQQVTATEPFQSGLIEIQDEGSQLVVAAVSARPEMRILDYCAGAGGKTLGMAMEMGNRGHIVACDVSEPRLEGAVKRFRRAGVHNVERHLLVSGDKWAKRRAGSFDRVLVDAPCSGTGTWRRNPDARLRLLETDLNELVAKQAAILDRAAALVKPGGRLIYATCSVLPAENQSQVEAFIKRKPEFSLVEPDGENVPEIMAGKTSISLSPFRNGTDGFYAAVLQRREIEPSTNSVP